MDDSLEMLRLFVSLKNKKRHSMSSAIILLGPSRGKI